MPFFSSRRGVQICFAGVADDCHYRGDVYRGPDPTTYVEEDPEFLDFDMENMLLREWLKTEILFVRLSGGKCKFLLAIVFNLKRSVHCTDVVIFPRTASHLPHRVMPLDGWTTFQCEWSVSRRTLKLMPLT